MDRKNDELPEDAYLGNIWGWKFSLFGLFLIVGLGTLMVYRHYSLDIPFSGEMEVRFSNKSYHHARLDSMNLDSLKGN